MKNQSIKLFVQFENEFNSTHNGKMKNILSAYGIPTYIVEAVIILYRDTRLIGGTRWRYTILRDNYWCITRKHACTFPFYDIEYLEYFVRKSLDDNKHLDFTITN